VAINCAAMVKATLAVLPGMLARGKGAIVNISSGAGTPVATPLLAVYGASKAFVDHFTLSLAEEYKGKGIDFQVTFCQRHKHA
jgi:17beta-estradiol 17-dehydrogenase / very-long-chain 3-oxoacyl-CoA reductase